ncbi:MAG: ankyrin repeat domain-containing protein [Proteobacteria bacterium]|nr:ankyrin repeat domain-containing protein [Pseudomonadota bacterium]
MKSYWDERLINETIKGKLESVKACIQRGANINAQNDAGNTALHYTARFGRLNICKLLLEKGADVHIKNMKGDTPYDMAEQGLVVPIHMDILKIANLLKAHIKNNISKKIRDKLNDIEI